MLQKIINPAINKIITSPISLLLSPKQLSGLELWLDAADTSVIIQSANLISQWSDKSGKANHATQSSGALQPQTNISSQAGRNIIDFNGANQLLLPSSLYSIVNSDNTLFAVCKSSLSGIQQRIINGTESGSSRYLLQYTATPGSVTFLSRTSTSGGPNITGVGTEINIFSCYKSGTTLSIQKNNGTPNTTTAGANEPDVNAMTIGSNTSGSLQLTGSIAEIIIYSRALTTNEISQVNNYLSKKWGIVIS